MTTMTETSVTTQVYRVYIKAAPEAIWDAITDPDWTERYGYGGRAEFDLRPGAERCASGAAQDRANLYTPRAANRTSAGPRSTLNDRRPAWPGTWLADNVPAPFRFSLPERGWLAVVGNRSVGLTQFDEPSTFLGVMAPQQVFTPAGGVRRLKSVDQLLEVLRSNPNLAILARERVQIGDVPAVQLTLRVLPHKGFPDFCPAPSRSSPCRGKHSPWSHA